MRGPRTQPRFPIEPLLRIAALNADMPLHAARGERCPLCPHDCFSTINLADALGTSTRLVNRWHADGVPSKSADKAAVALGLHPLMVWPDFYNDVLPEVAA